MVWTQQECQPLSKPGGVKSWTLFVFGGIVLSEHFGNIHIKCVPTVLVMVHGDGTVHVVT